MMISIHAPRMGSDFEHLQPFGFQIISIHAPRMGSDPRTGHAERGRRISIHAPRMGSDQLFGQSVPSQFDFNPRSPDGERPATDAANAAQKAFQSTLPGWGATQIQRQIF